MILVIDDDPIIQEILKSIFSTLNFGCYGLSSDSGLTELFSSDISKDIKAVLCDLNLGTINGYDVLMKIKRSAPLLPFVLMSAEHDSTIGSVYPLQPDFFLEKPFTVESVSKLLESLGITKQG